MKLLKNISKAIILLLAVSLASCSLFTAENSFNGGYAKISLTQGNDDAVYEFTIPVDASEDVYAETTTAADNALVKAYKIQAKNGYEKPYEAFSVKFVPEQIDADGNKISPKATVVFTEICIEEGTYYHPMSRTFEINSSTDFSAENYKISSVKGGKIFLNWTVDDKNSVPANQNYTEWATKSYNLKSVEFAAIVK